MEAIVKNDPNIDSSHSNQEAYQQSVGCSSMDRKYAIYVLTVLLLVYIFNFLDRQILSILAEDIKRDLSISDSQLGFLFGTAFAVFYATFGIVLARLADTWNRTKLIAIGLGFWSVMTAASGFAKTFSSLAFCRFCVGIGESSATPAAYSLLYDYFSAKVRTTVLAIYSSGVYIGAGLGIVFGGLVVDGWNNTWPDSTLAPFGLKGWQAAFMLAGTPGLLLSIIVYYIKEPIRGGEDGILSSGPSSPKYEITHSLVSMVPILNLYLLLKGNTTWKPAFINTAVLLVIYIAVSLLTYITGDGVQWWAFGIGAYAAFSWVQGLANRDYVIFCLIFKCKTIVSMVAAACPVVFMGVSFPFWAVPYFQRYHGLQASEVGMVYGIGVVVMGFSGMLLGGFLADKLRKKYTKGKFYVWFGGMLSTLVSAYWFLQAENIALAYLGIFLVLLTGAMASSPYISILNDLVLPRGRATVSAFSLMMTTFIGVALGPYLVGYISDFITSSGEGAGASLRQAMSWSLIFVVSGIVPALVALRNIEDDERTLVSRARELGENI